MSRATTFVASSRTSHSATAPPARPRRKTEPAGRRPGSPSLDVPVLGHHFAGVSDKPKPQPQRTSTGESMTAAREARLAAALRANLQRRKAQSRERRDSVRENAPPHPNPLPAGENGGPA